MPTVYVATFVQIGNGSIHTIGVFRNPNQAFHALHNFAVFRYPQFFTNMTNFPVTDLVHFGEDFNENENFDHLFEQFVERFIVPFTDNRFRSIWNLNISASLLN
jgi:hypothetical protein